MVGKYKFTAKQVIEAIEGSGAIKSTIAKKLNCSWNTIDVYIQRYPTVAQAFEDESAKVDDLAESIIIRNMQLHQELQRGDKGVPVLTGDEKWWLSRRRRKVFGDSLDLTSDNEPLTEPITVIEIGFINADNSDGNPGE